MSEEQHPFCWKVWKRGFGGAGKVSDVGRRACELEGGGRTLAMYDYDWFGGDSYFIYFIFCKVGEGRRERRVCVLCVCVCARLG